MYKSPIEMIMGQIRTQQEDHVFKAVQEVGITVDKEELLKALKYDRDQYNKGYHDALVARSMLAEDIKEGVAREIFAEIERIIGDKYNHYVFGNNDLDSIEQDAIINFSDTLSACFDELKRKYTGGDNDG